MSQRRRKSERTKNLHFQGLFAYSEKFSKIKPSGNMYIMKGIFSDQIIFMVHIPFKCHVTIMYNSLKIVLFQSL